MLNLFKSKAEKRQEQVAAYIDQQMGAAERDRFEALLGADAELQAELEAQQAVKSLLRQAPRLTAPRNFTLDPAVYGGKAPAPSFIELLYPKLRLATAAASFMFVILLGIGLLRPTFDQPTAPAPAEPVAVAPAIDKSADKRLDELEAMDEAEIDEAEDAAATEIPLPVQPDADDEFESEEELAELEVAAEAMPEEEAADGEMFDAAADSAPAEDVASDEAASGYAPEAGVAEAPVSPRHAEPTMPVGERSIEKDDAAAELAEAGEVDLPVAESEEETIQQKAAEDVPRVSADVPEVSANVVGNSAGSAAGESVSSPLSAGGIAIWFFGLLTLGLLVATMLVRRRLD